MSLERRLRRNRLRTGLIQTGDALTVLGRNFTQAAFMHGAAAMGEDKAVDHYNAVIEEAQRDSFNSGYAQGYDAGRAAAYSEVAGGATQ